MNLYRVKVIYENDRELWDNIYHYVMAKSDQEMLCYVIAVCQPLEKVYRAGDVQTLMEVVLQRGTLSTMSWSAKPVEYMVWECVAKDLPGSDHDTLSRLDVATYFTPEAWQEELIETLEEMTKNEKIHKELTDEPARNNV